jgi:UDP-N-acetylglucosamine diphosphorylase/glucosamine-1-phosphate N-acetyltransferase
MTDETKAGKNALAVVIMAAGKGTRMKNPAIAKVMHEIAGRPMIAYVVDLARSVSASRVLLVVGWQRQSVVDHFSSDTVAGGRAVEFVVQEKQLGTGHAVMQAREPLSSFDGDVLILSGDVPALSSQTVKALLGYHNVTGAVATILTAELPDPTGYGRIIRDQDESVIRIVEEKDASAGEKQVREINSGIYVFAGAKLFDALASLKPDNAQGEYYLTDIFEIFWSKKWRVSAVKCLDPVEVLGINDVDQLDAVRQVLQARAAGGAPVSREERPVG